MKRLLGLVLACILLAAITIPASAAGPNGEIAIGLDEDGTGSYKPASVSIVRLALNGVVLDSDVPAFIRGGRTMVPVRLITERMGASVQWYAQTNQVAISLNGSTVTLKIGSSQALVNGEEVTLYDGVPAMVANYNGIERTMVPLRFVSEQLGAQVGWEQETYTAVITSGETETVPEDNEVHTQKTVVLDAGHGGSDYGAFYEGICEKDINLAVAKKVEAILLREGYHVVMTRTEDTAVGLYTRAEIANAADADIFVSIHSNAAENAPDFTGIYTYYYPTSRQGAVLAQAIQTPLCASTGAIDRGIERADFVVLRETNMCAVLVEMGFMTNSAELRLLITPSYQDKLAAGIAEGIVTYLNGI
ncbi:MAG: N-acetylmuramoyl-L-alanine amidase [Oscillospiraceae bacterium]